MYRKKLTAALPNLNQLDDRPVTDLEHTYAEAFVLGGLDEERRVKKQYNDERVARQRAERAACSERAELAKKYRKIEMERMLANLRVQRDDLVQKRLELTREVQSMSKNHPDYNK
jgi:hypothetical protein